MAEPENFLERWSRKKREAVEESKAADAPATHAAPQTAIAPTPNDESAAAAPTAQITPPPEFDRASLPSLESITGQTDIRGFMAPEVPAELTRAALRRAWSADPAIRDFVGLQENDWDFNDPTAIPGFGRLPDGFDLKKMVAEVYGEIDKAVGQTDTNAAPASAGSPQVPTAAPVSPTCPSTTAAASQSDAANLSAPSPVTVLNAAAQQSISQRNEEDHAPQDEETAPPTRPRRHGSALPEV